MAARYDDEYDEDNLIFTASKLEENFDDLADLGARIAFPGGLQRLEVTIRTKSKADAYNRYLNHHGQRIVVYDSFIDKFIGGQIYEVRPDGIFCTYICAGSWNRLSMTKWVFGSRPTSGDTDDLIKDILPDASNSLYLFSNNDQSNIDGTSVDGGGWVNQTKGGSSSGINGDRAIAELVALGNSSDQPVHFYFVDGNFAGPLTIGLPKPYLKAVTTTADPDWQVEMKDISKGGLMVSRNIWNLKTSISDKAT